MALLPYTLPTPTPATTPNSNTVKFIFPTVSPIKLNIGMVLLQEPGNVLGHVPLNPIFHNPSQQHQPQKLHFPTIARIKIKFAMGVLEPGSVINHVPFTLQTPAPTPPPPSSITLKLVFPIVSPIILNLGVGFLQEPGSVLSRVSFKPLPRNPNPTPYH